MTFAFGGHFIKGIVSSVTAGGLSSERKQNFVGEPVAGRAMLMVAGACKFHNLLFAARGLEPSLDAGSLCRNEAFPG